MPWQAIGMVTGGLTLVAFLAAVAAWIYRQKLLADSELIRTAPENDRKELVFAKYGKLFDIDSSKMTKQQSYDLAVEQIRERANGFRTSAIVVVILAVLALIVTVVALVQNAEGVKLKTQLEERNKQLAEIKEVRDQLQQKLEKEQKRTQQLVGGVLATTELVGQSPLLNSETKALANTLKNLLVRFESDFGKAELSEVENLEIRLSKATLENAKLAFENLTSNEIGLNQLAILIQQEGGKAAVPFFMKMLSSNDSSQRLGAVDGLYLLYRQPKWEPSKSDVQTILDLTRDGHAKVAWSAIEFVDALGSAVDNDRLEETLRYLMKHGASEYVQDKARRMLKARGILEESE